MREMVLLKSLERDEEGFLLTLSDWTPEIAKAIAVEENIDLNDRHWKVIYIMRKFYKKYEITPPMRPFIKILANELIEEKVNSLYLYKLFINSPVILASKIAGLPKPIHCI